VLDERAVGDGAAGDEDGGMQGEEAEREDGAVPSFQLAVCGLVVAGARGRRGTIGIYPFTLN